MDDGSGTLRYDTGFAARIMGLPDLGLPDDLCRYPAPAISSWTRLDSHLIEGRTALNRHLLLRGVRSYFVVYDLLPLIQPDWFVPFHHFRIWVEQIATHCDGLLCISRSVARPALRQLPNSGRQAHRRRLQDRSFPSWAPISGTPSTAGRTSLERKSQRVLRSRHPVFLTVGTVEPRKGHAQALAAFERLWARGSKPNWSSSASRAGRSRTCRADAQPSAGRQAAALARSGIGCRSERALRRVYGIAGGFTGRGFRTAVDRGGKHGQPILARDIPVFHEIAGEHATYFSGTGGDDLAGAAAMDAQPRPPGTMPTTADMPWLTWEQSAARFTEVIFDDRWDATYHADRQGSTVSSRCIARTTGACPTQECIK